MLIPNLDKLTTEFDFDNALLSKKNINDFGESFLNWLIYVTFSLNVC